MNTDQIISKYNSQIWVASLGHMKDQSAAAVSLYTVLVCSVDALSSSSTYGSTANMGNITNSNIIVQNIENRLGVDMGVKTDAELRKVLDKNGAGPLYKLLKMVYAGKKKASKS